MWPRRRPPTDAAQPAAADSAGALPLRSRPLLAPRTARPRLAWAAPAVAISALSRHCRQHLYCAGMDAPVLKMTASARLSF